MTEPRTPTRWKLWFGYAIDGAESELARTIRAIEAEAAQQERERLLGIGKAAGPHEAAATVWSTLLADLD